MQQAAPDSEPEPACSRHAGVDNPAVIEASILRLAHACGPAKSISPTDVARDLAAGDGEWRRFLTPIRRTAQHLATAGRLEILRHGKPVEPSAARGVIRLRLPPNA